MEVTMLEIKNLSKAYKAAKGHIHKAVDGLNLHVNPGDIYGFIGHNGAGKTTTLRCVAGSLAFDEGEILVDGVSFANDPIGCKRSMAYVQDNPELYDNLTAYKYLKFIADVYQVPSDAVKSRVEYFAGGFEILEKLGDPIGSYSHGMKQKLALIAALIHEPKLLMLDEPFVGLDPKAYVTLRGFIGEIRERGGAIFFSTHVLDVAEKICNRVAIIKNGKLIIEGDMQTVKGDTSLENVFLELTEDAANGN
jgi:ABC-2 type transport system ATP-binding protein